MPFRVGLFTFRFPLHSIPSYAKNSYFYGRRPGKKKRMFRWLRMCHPKLFGYWSFNCDSKIHVHLKIKYEAITLMHAQVWCKCLPKSLSSFTMWQYFVHRVSMLREIDLSLFNPVNDKKKLFLRCKCRTENTHFFQSDCATEDLRNLLGGFPLRSICLFYYICTDLLVWWSA
jgi:hypothetical protein